jgi:dTMP kinase
MDLGLHPEPNESYRRFQARILEQYERLVEEFPLRVMDATRPVEVQQRELRREITPLLMGLARTGVEHEKV